MGFTGPDRSRGQPAGCGAARLTPRQAQIVRLAAVGLSSKEIARTLGIAKRTVDGYFTDARKRTGAKTRIELVAASAVLPPARPRRGAARPAPARADRPGKRRRGTPAPQGAWCPENRYFPDTIVSAAIAGGRPARAGQAAGSPPRQERPPQRRRHRGRPSVVTPEVIAAIRELRPAHTLKAIAEKIGISRSTLYAHMHEIAPALPASPPLALPASPPLALSASPPLALPASPPPP
jgi:DNA-binding CsgD family transcriptional regulator